MLASTKHTISIVTDEQSSSVPLRVESAHPGRLIDANSDSEAIEVWLKEVTGHTQRSYRREARRFYLFLTQYRQHSLATMTREDVLAYRDFAKNPPESWIGPAKPESHPEYRPFTGPLSVASLKQTMTILSGMMTYLVDAGYLVRNPFALQRRIRTDRDESTGMHRERGMSEDKWLTLDELAWLFNWLEQMPANSEADVAHRERAIWLIRFCYHTGARREEIADAKMGHFRMNQDAQGVVRWWWHVIGKGSKRGKVPVPDVLIRSLYRYRKHLGLTDIPLPNDETSAVRAIGGGQPLEEGLGEKGVYLTIKEIGRRAALDAPASFKHKLEKLSPHWFRHSVTTHELEAGLTLPEVAKNRRHTSITTTAGYAHSEENDRHDKVNRRKKSTTMS